LLLAACFTLSACFPSAQQTPKEDKARPPNMILIVTDDLTVDDLNPNTLKHMPNLRALIEKGTTFDNAFATNALCCPSRATILRGQYTHNHQILSNHVPLGGAEKFRYLGHENSTMATWAKEQGYRTALFGKYMNDYTDRYATSGWDRWYALAGNFLSDDLNENGRIVSYDPERYHLDDVISDKASDYAERAAKAEPPFFTTNRPFLMWIGTKAPHQPATPAARDENAYPDLALPEPPGFDEKDVSDKPGWVADNPPLGLEQNRYMKKLHRKRLQSMLAVDDMIGNLVKTLKQSGELNNTYIFFTSDHGFHLGEHRLGAGKWTPYEEERFRTGRGLAEGAGGAALDPRWGRPVPRDGAGVREHRRGRPPGLLRGRAKKGEARGDRPRGAGGADGAFGRVRLGPDGGPRGAEGRGHRHRHGRGP
jgi:N-acetylglucosamine-6-sulfatase